MKSTLAVYTSRRDVRWETASCLERVCVRQTTFRSARDTALSNIKYDVKLLHRLLVMRNRQMKCFAMSCMLHKYKSNYLSTTRPMLCRATFIVKRQFSKQIICLKMDAWRNI